MITMDTQQISVARSARRQARNAVYGSFILLSFIVSTVAQKSDVKVHQPCDQYPLGVYRQITGAKLKLSPYFNNNPSLFTSDADFKAGRWTLNPLDEVDPAYRIVLVRNTDVAEQETSQTDCHPIGKLVSPTGKLFAFKNAEFNAALRELKFMTIERDGLTYVGKLIFYPQSRPVSGTYEVGTASVTASGKTLGTVEIDFSFTYGS